MSSSRITRLLSAQHATPFAAFKNWCSEKGLLSTDDLAETDYNEGINDDATLFRFFSARKFDAVQAQNHFLEACRSRSANKLCDFYEHVDTTLYQETAMMYPNWTGRRDKKGQPLFLFDVTTMDAASMAAHDLSSKGVTLPQGATVTAASLRAYAVFESLTRFILPWCSEAADRPDADLPITKMMLVVDIETLGLRDVWRLKGLVQEFNKMVSLVYPEVLDRILIVGASSSFATIWSWAKDWIDPGTAAKLQILRADEVLPVLTCYIDIANIPQRFGGELPFEKRMAPLLDEKLRDSLAWTTPTEQVLPSGPLKWARGKDGSRVAVAVGSVDGTDRYEEFGTFRKPSNEAEQELKIPEPEINIAEVPIQV